MSERMHPHHFFAELCMELESLTRLDATNYQLTRASGILRLLFLDKQPLVTTINRDLRVPVTFEVSSIQADHDLGVPDMVFGFTTIRPMGQPTTIVKMSGFMNRFAIKVNSELYTVRNVVKCVAHIGGGIHYLPPENEREADLYEAAKSLEVNDRDMLLLSIRDISEVALTGLRPLLDATRIAP